MRAAADHYGLESSLGVGTISCPENGPIIQVKNIGLNSWPSAFSAQIIRPELGQKNVTTVWAIFHVIHHGSTSWPLPFPFFVCWIQSRVNNLCLFSIMGRWRRCLAPGCRAHSMRIWLWIWLGLVFPSARCQRCLVVCTFAANMVCRTSPPEENSLPKYWGALTRDLKREPYAP